MKYEEITTGPLAEQVFDETFPLWGDGLSRLAYARWNEAQMRTAWGRANLHRVGLVDDGRVVASAKRYLFEVELEGRPASMLGIGAVFTPESHRGRGLAPALIARMLEDAAMRGCTGAILFSEIGADYYRKLGFVEVPRTVVTVDVPRSRRGAPGTMVRSLEPGDLSEIAGITQRFSSGAWLALSRPAAMIEYAISRRRLRAGLGPAGLRHVEAFVSEEGHKPVSWVVLSHGPEGTHLEDCGDRDPSGARVGAMLEALAERDPALTDRTLSAWFPGSMRPPQVRISEPFRPAEVMMVKAIGSATDLPHANLQTYWPTLDIF